jgi:hypothetical protein
LGIRSLAIKNLLIAPGGESASGAASSGSLA